LFMPTSTFGVRPKQVRKTSKLSYINVHSFLKQCFAQFWFDFQADIS
jgi:hypothetical protein